MNPRRIRGLQFVAVMFAAALAAIPAFARTEGRFERTLQVNGPVDLQVSTGSGSIHVRAGSDGSVRVVCNIRANNSWRGSDSDAEQKIQYLEAHPPIEQDGNTIRIGHVDDEELTRHLSLSYEIETPAATQLRSTSGSGSLDAEGIAGPVEATTGSGSIGMKKIGGEVNGRTGSGGITLEDVHGAVHAQAGSGGITGRNVAGNFTASTGSGSIELEQSGPGDVDIETGSGGAELRGVKGSVRVSAGSGSISVDGAPAGPWRLRTGSGSVEVRLPQDAAFELSARTGSGGIESSLPITVQGRISPREIHGTVHGGGPLMELSTSSGNIRIEQ
ncbi:MAG: DUF4097 family beta strand repeat-containing protein [Candidatus Acidiferrales bacterium]